MHATPPAATGGATDAATDAANGGGGLIGIAMPTKALERWNRDGSHLVELLEAAGFETSLQYADNKTDQQISQEQCQVAVRQFLGPKFDPNSRFAVSMLWSGDKAWKQIKAGEKFEVPANSKYGFHCYVPVQYVCSYIRK